MQWVVYFGMRVYFPWKIIWNQRFIRMQWVVYFGMRVYLPWETIPDQSLNRMKEQNSKSYLLEFRNIYFNYKFFWLNFRFSYFFMRGGLSTPSTPYIQRNSVGVSTFILSILSYIEKPPRKIYYQQEKVYQLHSK